MNNNFRKETLKAMLEEMEVFRADLMDEINEMGVNANSSVPTSVYPPANIEKFVFNDSTVFQFSYHGALPTHRGMSKQYNDLIRSYYHNATASSFSKLELGSVDRIKDTNKIAVIFAHFYKNLRARDLDNRNKKYVLDAIKDTRIFNDDTWQEVTLFDKGFLDRGYNHLQVFVLPESLLCSFLKDLEANAQNYIKNKRFKEQFKNFENDYKKCEIDNNE